MIGGVNPPESWGPAPGRSSTTPRCERLGEFRQTLLGSERRCARRLAECCFRRTRHSRTFRQTSHSLLLLPEAVASMRLARATAPGAFAMPAAHAFDLGEPQSSAPACSDTPDS